MHIGILSISITYTISISVYNIYNFYIYIQYLQHLHLSTISTISLYIYTTSTITISTIIISTTHPHTNTRMCKIANYDIVCDAMCGGGSIPIEAGLNWRNSFHLAGDYNDISIERVAENIAAINAKPKTLQKLAIMKRL